MDDEIYWEDFEDQPELKKHKIDSDRVLRLEQDKEFEQAIQEEKSKNLKSILIKQQPIILKPKFVTNSENCLLLRLKHKCGKIFEISIHDEETISVLNTYMQYCLQSTQTFSFSFQGNKLLPENTFKQSNIYSRTTLYSDSC